MVAPGTLLALFAGIYYWFPKATGRKMSDLLGKIHFWGSFVCLNGVFLPMFIQGLAGVNRRLYDGGMQYAHAGEVLKWNTFMSHSAWVEYPWKLRCRRPWRSATATASSGMAK